MMYDLAVNHRNEDHQSSGSAADVTSWAAAGTETDVWTPSERGIYTRRERQVQTGPYKRAVLPAIASATPWLSSDISAHVDEATAEIVRFDAEMGTDIAPFSAVLLRTESAASSRIERLTASARAVATAEVDERAASRNAAEIVANTHAMQAAVDLADRLDSAAVLAMHRVLMASHLDVAGQWRRQQVWIGPGDAGPRIADYVPPRYESVPVLMDDLTGFMARNDVPVLVQAAVAHAQFENVHPFADGNGRTGRALVHAILRNKGLTVHATVPVSAGLLTDTQGYFDALTAYRGGAVTPIVSMVATAAIRAIANSRELVADLRDLRDEWNGNVKARRAAAAWRLADLLIRQPVITTETVTTELDILPGNVARTLRPFEEAGVLVSSAGSVRNSKVWRAPQVLARLDSFADRAGRRRAR
jgi:Fic family protein